MKKISRCSSLTDHELVTACQQGDTSSFAVLYYRYRLQLYSFCFKKTHNAFLVKDLMQDAYTNAFISICKGGFKEKGNFMNWLFSIASNTFIDEFRRRRRQRDALLPLDISDEAFIEQAGCNTETVESIYLFKELQSLITASVSHDTKMRNVVTLRYIENLKGQEIADELGIPLNTVKQILRRFRYKVAPQLLAN